MGDVRARGRCSALMLPRQHGQQGRSGGSFDSESSPQASDAATEERSHHRDAFDLPAAELTPAAYRRQMKTTYSSRCSLAERHSLTDSRAPIPASLIGHVLQAPGGDADPKRLQVTGSGAGDNLVEVDEDLG